jgi:hypothetical protein
MPNIISLHGKRMHLVHVPPVRLRGLPSTHFCLRGVRRETCKQLQLHVKL